MTIGEYHTAARGQSKKLQLMNIINDCMRHASNREEFIALMESEGYKVRWEKSRAKERIFSFRDRFHQWDPKNQRPELWDIYNAKIHKGESIRVFPLSNWTGLDIWQYIRLENIPIVPLYFAKERPVVNIDGNLIMADDDRLPSASRHASPRLVATSPSRR